MRCQGNSLRTVIERCAFFEFRVRCAALREVDGQLSGCVFVGQGEEDVGDEGDEIAAETQPPARTDDEGSGFDSVVGDGRGGHQAVSTHAHV